jgi:hypothetical protein
MIVKLKLPPGDRVICMGGRLESVQALRNAKKTKTGSVIIRFGTYHRPIEFRHCDQHFSSNILLVNILLLSKSARRLPSTRNER